jgi:hypothetical protein
MVRLSSGHVARVVGVERRFAGLQVHAIGVGHSRVALVQLNQSCFRTGRFERDDVGTDFLVRPQVADLLAGDVSLTDTPVLVAVLVLRVQDAL